MKTMKKLKYIGLLFLTMAVTFSCEKEEIMSFQADDAVNFQDESITYSFLTNPEEEYIQEIEVRIMGVAKDYDRYFEVEIIDDELTTAQADQFEIIGGVVKANEYTGTLSIKVYNSSELADEEISLHLRLSDSQDFKKGNIESSEFLLTWTDKVVVPNWRWYSYFFTRVPSTEAYRAVVASTGLVQFEISDYLALGPTGAEAMGTQFGDYVKQWNKDNPDNPLRHDDGPLAGELIEPIYYTKSKFD